VRLARLEKELVEKKKMEKERLANTTGTQTDKYLSFVTQKQRGGQQNDKEV
jgi:hypothetical protein